MQLQGAPTSMLNVFQKSMQKMVTFPGSVLKQQYLFLAQYTALALVVCHISWLQGMFCNVASSIYQANYMQLEPGEGRAMAAELEPDPGAI